MASSPPSSTSITEKGFSYLHGLQNGGSSRKQTKLPTPPPKEPTPPPKEPTPPPPREPTPPKPIKELTPVEEVPLIQFDDPEPQIPKR